MLLLLLLVTPPAPPHMWGSSRAGATGLPAPPRGGGWGVETAWCHRLLLLLLSGSWAGGVEPTPLLVPHGWGGGGGGGYGWLLTWRGGDVRTLGRLAIYYYLQLTTLGLTFFIDFL